MASWFKIFQLFVRASIRQDFPSRTTWVFVLLGEFVTLSLYYYTARVFVPKAEFLHGVGVDYFSFVVFGELVLTLPAYFVYAVTRSVKQAVAEGTVDPFLMTGQRPAWVFSVLTLGQVPGRLLQFLFVILIAKIIFGFSVSFIPLVSALVLVLLSLPCFLGLGMMAASLYLRFGRGDKAIHFLTNLAGVFGGVYFPLAVFPGWAEKLLTWGSPFSTLLAACRAIVTGSASGWSWVSTLIIMSLWGVVGLAFGVWMLENEFRSRARTGEAVLLVV